MAACELHHVLAGPADAPAIVLVGSLGSDLRMWDAQVGPLAERFRVVRFDTRGHGASPVPPGPYSLADLGKDVLALLDRVGIASASICGVSLGGVIAMWCAIHAPERLDRLVVCFSSAWFGPSEAWLERAALVRAKGTAAVADAVVARWLTDSTKRARPELVERLRAMIAATPAEGYAACCEALAATDLRGRLGAIAAPTLAVSGSEDPATPPEHGRAIAAAIPGARFVEIPAAAHLGNIERPEQFNEALLVHLDQARSGRDTPRSGRDAPVTKRTKELSG
jgi:3-oxoadipate enol-lactonase